MVCEFLCHVYAVVCVCVCKQSLAANSIDVFNGVEPVEDGANVFLIVYVVDWVHAFDFDNVVGCDFVFFDESCFFKVFDNNCNDLFL